MYTVKMASDINERLNKDFEIFPNPVNSKLAINAEGTLLKSIVLYNRKGQKVLEKSIRAHNANIDVSGYDMVMYFLIIQKDNEKASKKVLISH